MDKLPDGAVPAPERGAGYFKDTEGGIYKANDAGRYDIVIDIKPPVSNPGIVGQPGGANAPDGLPPALTAKNEAGPTEAQSGVPVGAGKKRSEYDEFSSPSTGDNAPVQANPYDEFSAPSHASPMENLAAFTNSAASAAYSTGGAVAGMAMGAGLGALGGPLAPATVPAGALGGFIAGYFGGEHVGRLLGVKPAKELPENLRPMGYAGEAIGGGASVAGATTALARSAFRFGATKAGGFLNSVLDYAKDYPLRFFAREMSGNIGAGVGAFEAETIRPGETGPRIAAEIAGGILSPTRVLAGAVSNGAGLLYKLVTSFSRDAQQTTAARMLQELVKQTGEDIPSLVAALKASGMPGMNLTAAQLTGSRALANLEAKLSGENGKFGEEVGKKAAEGFDALRNMVVALRGTGKPEALKAAAEIEALAMRAVLDGNVRRATAEAAAASGNITSDAPGVMARLSARATDLIETVLREARTAERELWGRIDEHAPATVDNFLGEFAAIMNGRLPGRGLDSVIEQNVRLVTPPTLGNGAGAPPAGAAEQFQPTIGYLLKLRSDLLNLAREADAAVKPADARAYGRLAEAVLEDITAAGEATGQREIVDTARTFSRELNDTFSRTFAGSTQAASRSGASRIQPEEMLRKALGTGAEAGDLRLAQLSDATAFLTSQGLGSPEAAAAVPAMLALQERMLRLAALKAVDPNTGIVSPKSLGNFIRNNDALLERFPVLRADLQRAVDSQIASEGVQRQLTGATRAIEDEAALKLLTADSPSTLVAQSFTGATPVLDFKALADVARRGGAQAVEGLKAAVWNVALSKAEVGGEFSFQKLASALSTPVKPGLPTPLEMMITNKIITPGEAARLEQIIAEAQKIAGAMEGEASAAVLMDNTSALVDTVIRIAGAKAASAVAGLFGPTRGSGLIIASRGSSYARMVMETVPAGRVKDVMLEAARNPKFMAMLLEKPVAQVDKVKLALQIHSYLVQAGISNMANSDLYPDQQ